MAYQKGPWIGDVECGTHAFCACGETENSPFCDGSHSRKDTGKAPCVTDVEKDGKLAICRCGQTGNAPFCDGSHNRAG